MPSVLELLRKPAEKVWPLKVLFATSQSDDFIACCLWDGLQEVLGEENVFDAACNWNLHAGPNVIEGSTRETARHISATRKGRMAELSENQYDLLVLNACFLRERDWHWVISLLPSLKRGAKIAYIEGWDSAHEVHDPAIESNPPVQIDAYFRREIDPTFPYPYPVHHLAFAAPERWFPMSYPERPIDVAFCGIPHSNNRLLTLIQTISHSHNYHCVISTGKLPMREYFNLMRHSKLALCPSGGAKSECLRTFEVTACGAIPIFIDYPPWRRDDWFTSEHAFFCGSPNELPSLLPLYLNYDLSERREKMVAHAGKYHTTRSRAETLLKTLGVM